jgi:hypothetical protein
MKMMDVSCCSLEPFTNHSYHGVVPSFTGKAVKVTVSPGQVTGWSTVMVTEGNTISFTVRMISVDVIVTGLAQGSLEVSVQVTKSLLTRVLVA